MAKFVEKTRTLLLQQSPQLRDPNEAARFLRLSPALLSTLSPEQVLDHQRSVEQAIQQERERQERIKAMAQAFPGLLMPMALIYRVALFDAFVSDIQLCVLTQRPELLKNDDRTLTYTEIVEGTMQNRLIDLMAESTVTSLDRYSIAEQLKKIGNRLQIGFKPEAGMQEPLTELIARRNIFTHANGIVNRIYLSLVPNSPFPVGTKLEVSSEYWIGGHQLSRTVCDRLLKSVFGRYCQGITAPTV